MLVVVTHSAALAAALPASLRDDERGCCTTSHDTSHSPSQPHLLLAHEPRGRARRRGGGRGARRRAAGRRLGARQPARTSRSARLGNAHVAVIVGGFLPRGAAARRYGRGAPGGVATGDPSVIANRDSSRTNRRASGPAMSSSTAWTSASGRSTACRAPDGTGDLAGARARSRRRKRRRAPGAAATPVRDPHRVAVRPQGGRRTHRPPDARRGAAA